MEPRHGNLLEDVENKELSGATGHFLGHLGTRTELLRPAPYPLGTYWTTHLVASGASRIWCR